MNSDSCPSEELLRAFAFGDLPDTEIEAIALHLGSCHTCESELTKLDHGSDWLVRDLRARVGAPSGDTTVEESLSLSRLLGDGNAGEPVPEHLGHLRLIRELGRGGMGVVYEAFEGTLNRHVAIKMLPSRGDLARFRREARAAGRLHHTNIVPVFGIGEYREHHYYVMQFIEGRALNVVLEERQIGGGSATPGEREVHEAARIGVQAAEALAYAHAQGVIHRDVKPSNLLLDRAGTVWITDFGLASDASDAESLTHTGDFLGTLRYVAPERIDGRGDHRADQYGLGVCLYELACGRPAFGETDRAKLVHQVLHQSPARPTQINSHVPRDLETIILKAMDRDQDRRYAGTAALAADLRRFLEGRPIAARPISPGERLVRWSRRNPWLAAAVGSIAAALLAIAALGALYASQKSRIAAQQTEIARQESASREHIEGLNLELTKRGADLEQSLSQANLNQAMFHFERGQDTCERGEIAPGLLYLVECWRSAIAAGPSGIPWRRTARESLSLWQRRLPALEMVFPHEQGVSCVAVSPDGHTMITGCTDGAARLWDLVTGRPKGDVFRHGYHMSAVAFTLDGRSVVTASFGGAVRFWDAETGQPKGQPLQHGSSIESMALSPDGKTLLTGGHDGLAKLWDLRSGRPIGEPLEHSWMVKAVAFSPDGKIAATAAPNRIFCWDVASCRLIKAAFMHPATVESLTFSLDGKVLVTGCDDHQVRFWNFADATPLGMKLVHEGEITSVQFAPDGRRLLTASGDGTARVWDATTGAPAAPRLTHQAPVSAAVFGPDGKTIFTASVDKSARQWNYSPRAPSPLVLQHEATVDSVTFSPDGTTAVTASLDGTARLWNVATGVSAGKLLHHSYCLTSVCYAQNGRTVAVGGVDHVVRLIDVATGRQIVELPKGADQILGLAFASAGQTLASVDWSGVIRTWDPATGRPRGPAIKHSSCLFGLAMAPDGKSVAAGSLDRTARFWDTAAGRELGPVLEHPDSVLGVAYSPDGKRLLTGCSDDIARLWDCATGRLAGPIFRHRGRTLAVAFRPDGQAILTGSDDHTARLWDVTTGQSIGPPLRHDGSVLAVAFSPDGRSALTGSTDTTARIWDVSIELPDDVEHAARFVEVRTGLRLDERGDLHAVDARVWHEGRDKLRQDSKPTKP